MHCPVAATNWLCCGRLPNARKREVDVDIKSIEFGFSLNQVYDSFDMEFFMNFHYTFNFNPMIKLH